MSIVKRGDQFHGDDHADIVTVLTDYSKRGRHLVAHSATARCSCGADEFRLAVDDAAGIAVRECAECDEDHSIGAEVDEVDEDLEDANLEVCECPCGADTFQIAIGVAVQQGTDAARWVYVGCRCTSCGLLGCYADWKCDVANYRRLLALV